ncbi:hypothetical protein CSW58_02465 [Caulobacter sp. B11]|uniref:hypothetical protein n=1 Tax=Caulobacter sp. B11 TaxID=2048899 RepID=UPI000C12D157|nr:hypothetical protein [Caulobacter sp. B11]PHY13952.1 hypothetical protein CSW58_02465 [Caulobacter sp. B11]
MTTPFSYAVNFQIRHPTAHADELAVGLPWKAQVSWTVGDESTTPNGVRTGGVRSQSYCTFRVEDGDDGQLAACLSRTADGLAVHHEHFAELRRTGGALSFYVFWYPGGDTGEVFTAELMAKMASLGIDFGLNVYDDRTDEN